MNTFESTLIKPADETRGGVIGVYAMPINATMNNTGDRLAALANRVGFPLLAVDFYNQDRRTSFGLPARDANVASGEVFAEMSGNRLDFVLDMLNRLPKREKKVGIGDSLGVPAIEGMALYSPVVFDALVLRDGWNLGPEEGAISGITRYLRYQVRDAMNNRLNPRNLQIPRSDYSSVPLSRPSEVNPLQKIWNVAPAMAGTESRDYAAYLAGRVPMHVVLFEDGLSGTTEQANDFRLRLENAAKTVSHPKPLKVSVVPGWHTDLLDPARGAENINETLALLNE